MRKIIAFVCALLLCALCAAAGEADTAEAYKQKYEESVAFKAIRTLARFASDDLSLDQSVMSFIKDSEAWKYMRYFDDGSFASTKVREFKDYRSENWEVKSETEFCCDVYMTMTVTFSTNSKVYDFPCAYHFCFRRTNAEKDFWQAYDFYNLPCQSEELLAAKITVGYEGVSLYPVTGKTFRGYMMVIDDPSRVFVGTIDHFGEKVSGQRINELVAKFGVLGAINGGGFSDNGGNGTGGQPYGLVIADGVMKKGPDTKSEISNVVMGFDKNNKLVVGKLSYNQIIEAELRDALAFHPALIIEGEDAQHSEKRMYTIRTAIGQDAEGRVLMLIVKGRQPDSLGASVDDLREVMRMYGAINAGNLDGGSSTALYWDGQCVYSGYWPVDSRRLPAAFMIKDVQ